MSVYLVVTPGVLLLDYAGPAEALRMARDMGAPLTLYTCGPLPDVPTSLGTQLTGLEPLPQPLPPNSLVLITGKACGFASARDFRRVWGRWSLSRS